MEIKTCEEYVLLELENCQKQLDLANSNLEATKKMLKVVNKYFKKDDYGNIIVSEFSYDPISHGRVLNCLEQDKEIFLAISYFDKCGKLDNKCGKLEAKE